MSEEATKLAPELEKIVDQLSGLTVMQMAELKKALEEKWDVKAAAGGAMMMAPAAGAGEAPAEKDSFDVVLESAGASKIAVIKEVRAITGLGLKEAKELVDAGSSKIKEAVKKAEAEEIKTKLEAAGATIKLT